MSDRWLDSKLREATRELARNKSEFFEQIKGLLPENPIIFYPGSGPDDSLTLFFDESRIIHLDRDPSCEAPPNSVAGQYAHNPLKDDSVDLMYISDNHANEEEFNILLKSVKIGGYVIFDDDTCGPYKPEDAFTNPQLQPLGFLGLNTVVGSCHVFRKK